MGKGDKYRPTDKKSFDKGYVGIDWGNKNHVLDREFHTKQKDVSNAGVRPPAKPNKRGNKKAPKGL